jgi:hypothetical protein
MGGPPDQGVPVGITVPEVPIVVPPQPEPEPDPSIPHPVEPDGVTEEDSNGTE